MDDTERSTKATVGGVWFSVGAAGLSGLLFLEAADPQGDLWPNQWFVLGLFVSAVLTLRGAVVSSHAERATQFYRSLALALGGGAIVGLVVGVVSRNVDAGLWSGIAFAVLSYVATLPLVSAWLPRVALKRRGKSEGFVLEFLPPMAPGKEKLRQETFALVKDIWDHVRSRPDPRALGMSFRDTVALAQDDSLSQDEKTRIYREQMDKEMEQYARERLEIEELFGGRVRYVVQEYVRRGMLADNNAKMMGHSFSLHWIRDTAVQLEALARRL
jgi:hypothetical protein